MTTYRAQHDALFRTVAGILVRDYIAPSETADTVEEWCTLYCFDMRGREPYGLAALIADIEGYERKQG